MKTKPSTVHSTCKVRSSATENQPQHKCRWLGSVLSHHLSLSPKCPEPGSLCFVQGAAHHQRIPPTPQTMCGCQTMEEDSQAALVPS